MVKTALVAMTLLGCDCDAKICEFVSEAPRQFAPVAECEEAMQSHVLRNSALDYPLVTGQCRVVSESDVQLASAESPALTGQPADSTLSIPTPATTSLVFEKTASSYGMVTSGVGRAADFVFQTARSAAGSVTPALERMASLLP